MVKNIGVYSLNFVYPEKKERVVWNHHWSIVSQILYISLGGSSNQTIFCIITVQEEKIICLLLQPGGVLWNSCRRYFRTVLLYLYRMFQFNSSDYPFFLLWIIEIEIVNTYISTIKIMEIIYDIFETIIHPKNKQGRK